MRLRNAAPALIAVDFDGTITRDDTTAALGRVTGAHVPFSAAVERYLTLVHAARPHQDELIRRHRQRGAAGTPADRTVLGRLLREYVELLRPAERAGRQMVETTACLHGLHHQHIVDLAQQVALRDEWVTRTLSRAVNAGVALHIISLNWSRQLLANVLPFVAESNIHCNSIHSALNGGPPIVEGMMMTGADKADVFAVLRKHHAGPAVFIGDSPHDLPSLLDADLGIVIGRHEVMIQLCADLDIALVPTTQWTPRPGDAPPALLAVESWREIHDLLFECGLACWHAVPGKEDRADASPL